MKRNNAQISILDEIIVDNFAGGGGKDGGGLCAWNAERNPPDMNQGTGRRWNGILEAWQDEMRTIQR